MDKTESVIKQVAKSPAKQTETVKTEHLNKGDGVIKQLTKHPPKTKHAAKIKEVIPPPKPGPSEEELKIKAKEELKLHEEKLHPLKSEMVQKALLNMATNESVDSVKTMVRFELILTLILVIAIGGFGFLVIRNPNILKGLGSASSADSSTTPTPSGPSGSPTPAGTFDASGGRVIKDARDQTLDNSSNSSAQAVPNKDYENTDMGFKLKYPDSWKLEETTVGGKKNTKISNPAAKFETYISFQTTKPDGTAFASQGSENKRDVYSYDTLYQAEGYVKYGNAVWAAIVVKPGSLYIVYAGNVENDILPVIATFQAQ
jgi:hypothetical protein